MPQSATPKSPPVEREAFTVAEFCRSIGISRAFFYKLEPAKRPAVIRLGRRVLITREATSEWRARMCATGAESAA